MADEIKDDHCRPTADRGWAPEIRVEVNLMLQQSEGPDDEADAVVRAIQADEVLYRDVSSYLLRTIAGHNPSPR